MFIKHKEWDHDAEGEHPYTDDRGTVGAAGGFRVAAVADGLVPESVKYTMSKVKTI